MLTLREFIEKVNFHEHYRIYHPNRDCLIFESYFKVHSPYYFDNKHKSFDLNEDYFNNNDYCNDVKYLREPDEETKAFLDKYGDYEVFSLECGGFLPTKLYKDESGFIQIEHVTDELQPDRDWIDCFNVFIKWSQQ